MSCIHAITVLLTEWVNRFLCMPYNNVHMCGVLCSELGTDTIINYKRNPSVTFYNIYGKIIMKSKHILYHILEQ